MHFSKRFLGVIIPLLTASRIVECELEEIISGNQKTGVLSSVVNKILNQSKFSEESPVETAINIKIEELKPYLQDEDIFNIEPDNNLTLEGKDETTIIEFIPEKQVKHGLRDNNEPFKEHVQKYKKLRRKIQKALKKEAVSDKTHELVIKTLDDLIAKLIGSQCSWKSGKELDSLHTSKVLNELWSQEWNKLKNTYLMKYKASEPKRIEEMTSFFDGLHTFFSFITKDIDTLSERYKIKCMFMDKPMYRKYQNYAYDSDTDLNRHNCNRFSICSRELRNFMIDFYNYLNDTTVSLIRNYAEMYVRDTDNFLEKPWIVSTINGTSIIMEKDVLDIFIKQTSAIKLNEKKNKDENIKALSNYVKTTIIQVRNDVKQHLEQALKSVKEKISDAIQADINVNLKVDLDNLEREVLGRICFIFRFCNGRYKGRRRFGDLDFNKKDIYVKVELTLDDELKESLNLNNMRRFFSVNRENTPRVRDTNIGYNFSYATNFNVTRTTQLWNFK